MKDRIRNGETFRPDVVSKEILKEHTKSHVIPGLDAHPEPDKFRQLHSRLIAQKEKDGIPYHVVLPMELELMELARQYRVEANSALSQPHYKTGV